MEFEHNVVGKNGDGNYYIRGSIRFEVMGDKVYYYTTLVECKQILQERQVFHSVCQYLPE